MDSVHVLVLLLSVLSLRVKGQNCDEATTCGDCYAKSGCAWCLSANFDGNRCFDPSGDTTCNDIENIDGSFSEDVLELTEDNQISLERANISLRVGDSQGLNISVKPAENFPLDLYMLVDLSFSLSAIIDTIRTSAEQIGNSLNDISTRSQIGFGVFIDKLLPPFVSRVQLDLSISGGQSACVSDQCARPFSYVHNTDLTSNNQMFASEVSTLNASSNADNPEGTLDAMLQSVVCQEIVGWRDNARKILLIITDAVLHSAGDGRIAGIIQPSISECLMRFDSSLNRYTYADNTEYDYPSIEQIRQVLEENTVSPIFAIRETDIFQRLYYENLAPMLDQRSEVVNLTDDASNIITAIATAYNNLVSQVALSFTAPDGIRIDYIANCPEDTITSVDGLSCSNVSTNQVLTFDITVTLQECTVALREQPLQEIMVNIPSYGQFVIAVEALCSCDCESMPQTNSSLCNFQGDYVCSVCECNDEWTGDDCTCRLAEIDDIACPTGPSGAECSGSSRGSCECGVCQCINPVSVRSTDNGQEVYTVEVGGSSFILLEPGVRRGNACECDNFRCPRDQNFRVCSLNGECVCDEMGNFECQCGTSDFGGFNYTSDACECNMAFCFNQGEAYSPEREPCGGNGECDPCNTVNPCTCNEGFSDTYCTPISLLQESCNEEQACIECISNNGDFRSRCDGTCNFDGGTEYVRLDEAVSRDYEIPNSVDESTSYCPFLIPDPLCEHVYYIARVQRNSTTVNVVHVEPRSSTCLALQWYAIALILLAGLIILGIVILIIIKLIFLCLDYKELKKFQKEVAEADLSKNFNPLYQSPNVNYTNVAFGKE